MISGRYIMFDEDFGTVFEKEEEEFKRDYPGSEPACGFGRAKDFPYMSAYHHAVHDRQSSRIYCCDSVGNENIERKLNELEVQIENIFDFLTSKKSYEQNERTNIARHDMRHL